MPVLLIALELAKRNGLSSEKPLKTALQPILTSQKLCNLATGCVDNLLIHLYKLWKALVSGSAKTD